MTHPLLKAEFYETPQTFTRYLFKELFIRGVVLEPTVGSGAIIQASDDIWPHHTAMHVRRWITNDMDPRWPADYHLRAHTPELWDKVDEVDWTVANPPFDPAINIVQLALEHSRIGVAMHLRASIHEVLRTGIRRTWMATHTPTGILWLPRFAYQRSKSTGEWTTDSVCACWVIWLQDRLEHQFIRYAPEWVINELKAETPAYRTRMDALMAAAA